MSDPYSYEAQIYGAIASSIGLDTTSLRLLPAIAPLPQSNYTLYQLLDLVPSSAPTLDPSAETPRFSVLYGQLLSSLPDSFVVTLALKNYQSDAYWLPADPSIGQPRTPIYTPDVAGVGSAVEQGSALSYTLDSSKTASPTGLLFPSFPSLVLSQPLLAFNQGAEGSRFNFSMSVDEVASPLARAGGWFSQAAFIQGYNSKGVGWKTGPGTVTWDELFGPSGQLSYVCTGLLAISGVRLNLRCFGPYDQSTVQTLEGGGPSVVWPFYLNVAGQTQSCTLNGDGSVTLTTVLAGPEVLLFLLTASPVSMLAAGGATAGGAAAV